MKMMVLYLFFLADKARVNKVYEIRCLKYEKATADIISRELLLDSTIIEELETMGVIPDKSKNNTITINDMDTLLKEFEHLKQQILDERKIGFTLVLG